MQKRKLQVFVSSTFKDLKIERQTAVQAILEAGHIPAGMELFIAEDASQWDIIKEWIDESDVYMLIIGGRYGSIEPESGKSYTHLEYEYALSVSKPHFVIVIDDETTQSKAKKDGVKITDFFDNSSELKEFKTSIMNGKLVSVCKSSDKMESSIHKSINKLSQRENLKGWVKADDTDLGASLEELARLSKENSELKSKLAEINKEDKINGMSILEMVDYLKNNTFDSNDSLLYRMHGKKFRSNNSLELLMGLAKEPHHISENGLKNKTLRFLMNQQLITPNAILTKNGSLLFMYVEQNKIQWHNNIEYNVPSYIGVR
jgi:Domain of unknown function (DUF4062)